MRPGQLTPENDMHRIIDAARGRASMRPGQLTPENVPMHGGHVAGSCGFNEAGAINPGKHHAPPELQSQPGDASMRPGQLTPENQVGKNPIARPMFGFNEAGAINPGKPRRIRRRSPPARGFNEAGAINPGKPRDRRLRTQPRDAASMRPGQLTPENRRMYWYLIFWILASMRPGQLTPENRFKSGASRSLTRLQ